MSDQLSDIVAFRNDRLFDGAVNIEWHTEDSDKAILAGNSFVFHGPEYHAVDQEDVGSDHGHRLIDTATFTETIVRRCYGTEKQPFTLAIAGYGTGKSHLGVTLARLLSNSSADENQAILDGLQQADLMKASNVQLLLRQADKPCLVVTLNGMREFNLTAEVSRQIRAELQKNGHDTEYLDELRPRFQQAKSLINLAHETLQQEIAVQAGQDDIKQVLRCLDEQDENIYSSVYNFFNDRGMPITVLSGESIGDIIDHTVDRYCGKNKDYQSLVVLFDEFGKYTEFATIRSQISGSGALQDLFEAVQSNDEVVSFVGFIQFDLNSYTQRVAPEYRNEILRYITRYQTADKLYLSINLETLIASLLERKDKSRLADHFANPNFEKAVELDKERINRWFPSSKNYRSWTDSERFETVIAKGCWPLSPYSTWLLYYLAAAGKHLQERSALALLGETFNKFGSNVIQEDNTTHLITPVRLCSESLIQELISAEELGQQGAIAHSYATVREKHGTRFSQLENDVLVSILLASKLRMVFADKDDATAGLASLMGKNSRDVGQAIEKLQIEYNVIEWDDSFKTFDILGDAVPRTQFLAFLRQQVSERFSEEKKANIFASRISSWTDKIIDLDCDFADDRNIFTNEWKFRAVTTEYAKLQEQIYLAIDTWVNNSAINEPKGTIFYCYLEPGRKFSEVENNLQIVTQQLKRKLGIKTLPFIVILLHDTQGKLGQVLAEKMVLESATEAQKAKFSNLIPVHLDKLNKSLQSEFNTLLRERNFFLPFENLDGVRRLTQIGNALFANLYPTTIPFPFDGFSSERGNAAKTCNELIIGLFHGNIDLHSINSKGVKFKNRVLPVLRNSWSLFNQDGSLTSRSGLKVLRDLASNFDQELKKKKELQIDQLVGTLCKPPYGANIASAGLFLACYVAARRTSLEIIKDGRQLGLSQWIDGNKVFKSNLFNKAELSVRLVHVGETSDEWKTFLDEWEASLLHEEKLDFLFKCQELTEKSSPPSNLSYRIEALKETSLTSMQQLKKLENLNETIWKETEQAKRRGNAGSFAKEACKVLDFITKMKREDYFWTNGQVYSLEEEYGILRQYSIQYFDEWLLSLGPRSETPEEIGKFKHFMLNIQVNNFTKIDCRDQIEKITLYTTRKLANLELEFNQKKKLRSITNWFTDTERVLASSSVIKLRELKKQCKQYAQELDELAQGTVTKNIKDAQGNLIEILGQIDGAEKEYTARAESIWNSEIKVNRDIDRFRSEIDQLVTAFQGLDTDLEDLIIMKDSLNLFQNGYRTVKDINLTWEEFDKQKEQWSNACKEKLEEEEIPWDYEEVIDNLTKVIETERKQESKTWLNRFTDKIQTIVNLDTRSCQQLLTQLSNQPPYLHREDMKKTIILENMVQDHLSSMKLDWLITEYQELDLQQQELFRERIFNAS